MKKIWVILFFAFVAATALFGGLLAFWAVDKRMHPPVGEDWGGGRLGFLSLLVVPVAFLLSLVFGAAIAYKNWLNRSVCYSVLVFLLLVAFGTTLAVVGSTF
jgi:hypothetical protein